MRVIALIGGGHGTLSVWTMLMSWDLLAGAWLSRDARRLRIHHGWVVASLVTTYLFGILGLFLLDHSTDLAKDRHVA